MKGLDRILDAQNRRINLKDPLDLCLIFNQYFKFQSDYPESLGNFIWFYNDEFYSFTGIDYEKCSEQYIRSEIYKFLKCVQQSSSSDLNVKKSSVENVLDALKADSYLPSLTPPFRISTKEELPSLIFFKNKILNTHTYEEIEHSSDFFSLNSLTYNYESSYEEPKNFLGFLNSVFETDPESILAFQEWFGLLVTDETKFQKALLVIGPKRSGKGTIGRILVNLIGHKKVTNPTLAQLGKSFGLSSFIEKTVALIADARLSRETDFAAIVENVLRITGEDLVSVERKFKENWEGKLKARFVVFSNESPNIKD